MFAALEMFENTKYSNTFYYPEQLSADSGVLEFFVFFFVGEIRIGSFEKLCFTCF